MFAQLRCVQSVGTAKQRERELDGFRQDSLVGGGLRRLAFAGEQALEHAARHGWLSCAAGRLPNRRDDGGSIHEGVRSRHQAFVRPAEIPVSDRE
jgi:hypothetical protein